MMIILVGCGREVGKDRCGDRQLLSGGAPYSGVVAVRFLVRLGVGKVCGIVSDGESGPVIYVREPGGGGWVTLSEKGGVGCPCVVVVVGYLDGRYWPAQRGSWVCPGSGKIYVVRRSEGLVPVLLATGKVEM